MENKTRAVASPEEIAELCVKTADGRKAENIIQLKVTEHSSVADYFVLCTGNSEPQIKAIADHIGRELRDKLQVRPRAVEGKAESQWILMDYGCVLVHIMTSDARELYQLESLWGDAPKQEAVRQLQS
jgi:ribosome-associated protein